MHKHWNTIYTLTIHIRTLINISIIHWFIHIWASPMYGHTSTKYITSSQTWSLCMRSHQHPYLCHETKIHTSTTCNQKLSSLTLKAHCSTFTNSELIVLCLIGSKQNTASMSTFHLSTPPGTLPWSCRMAEMQYEYLVSNNFYQSWRKTVLEGNI